MFSVDHPTARQARFLLRVVGLGPAALLWLAGLATAPVLALTLFVSPVWGSLTVVALAVSIGVAFVLRSRAFTFIEKVTVVAPTETREAQPHTELMFFIFDELADGHHPLPAWMRGPYIDGSGSAANLMFMAWAWRDPSGRRRAWFSALERIVTPTTEQMRIIRALANAPADIEDLWWSIIDDTTGHQVFKSGLARHLSATKLDAIAPLLDGCGDEKVAAVKALVSDRGLVTPPELAELVQVADAVLS